MEEQMISLTLAKEPVRLRLKHGIDPLFFEGFLAPSVPAGAPVVEVPGDRLEPRKALYPADFDETLLEFNEIPPYVSTCLLDRGCCMFHGAAFLWRGKVYIFTAPSGTGKSTQYVLWKELLGDGIRILNGDKPILRLEDDGAVWVHPSPWQGKERMGSLSSGPLGGIILLAQGSDNAVFRMKPADAVVSLFTQFLFEAQTEESVHRVCRLESRVLESVPVWGLINRGDTESARMCIDTITRFEEDRR